MKKATWAAGSALAVSLIAGVAWGATTGTTPSAATGQGTATTPSVVVGHGAATLPSETITDWVGYSDQIVSARVLSESEVPLTPEEAQRGEGYIGRTVTLQIDKRLWTRPGSTAPALADTFTLDASGWVMRAGQRIPFVMEEAPRVEVGHSYVFPMALLAGGRWSAISQTAIRPFDNGVVGQGESRGLTGTEAASPANAATEGSSPEQLTVLLNDTKPADGVAKYAHLDPKQRFEQSRATTG